MAPPAEGLGDASPADLTASLREWYTREVWGKRAKDDDALFEVMSLQVFQAGLTWNMVLARRDAFRAAFQGWSVDAVAELGPDSVERMAQDSSIIRNRKKIQACIENARTVQELRSSHGSFCAWFYNMAPPDHPDNAGLEGDDLASLQGVLRSTFKFMGPEIARMWLLAAGRISPEGH